MNLNAENMQSVIDNFHAWAEAHGLEFPCTAWEYSARAVAFLQSSTGWTQNTFDSLMEWGCGPDWEWKE